MRLLDVEAAEFAYGNTRLRARRSQMLGAAQLEGLLPLDLDGLMGVLAETAYRPELEAALPRSHGVRRLHDAVRAHLGRSLEEMRGFYDGGARAMVDLLLSRWDVRNLVTVLRGHAARVPVDELLPLLVPVGGLDEASAREVARQAEMAAAVQLLVAWRLPTPGDAEALAAAWPAYERSADLAALEHALVADRAARVAAALESAGDEAEPLRTAVRRELDDRNVLSALRLRESAERQEQGALPAAEVLVPGRAADRDLVAAAVLAPTRDEAAAVLARRSGAGHAAEPLARWADAGDLAALEDDLERARLLSRAKLFVTGDPLSIAVPLAFEAMVELEARNLRVLGEGAARGFGPEFTRPLLVLP